MSTPSAPITFADLTFVWPDGSTVLDGIAGTFASGRTGLVGRNGSGKSTLLRLIAGELTPTSGTIETAGPVGYLPQTASYDADSSVADLLGIGAVISAIQAIEAGDTEPRLFEIVGDDWDIEARAAEVLARIGFAGMRLDRRVDELSGGESMLIAIAGLRVRRTPISLLDEPTNNLDRAARARVSDLVDDWPGTLVVVSHDLDLLERMDNTAELYGGRLEVFGGPYSEWQAALEQEQAAAAAAVTSAKQTLKVEKRQRIEAETKLARRAQYAKKTQRDGGIPKIVAGRRAENAQVSAGAMRNRLDDKVASAHAAVRAADTRVRDDDHINLTLPDPDVSRGRRIAEITAGDRTTVVQGPERVALVGPNGSGKTALLRRLMGAADVDPARPHGRLLTERVAYLPQRFDELDDHASALANVQAVAPDAVAGDIRNGLARLLIRGDAADRPIRTLSGGERFRVSLATLLLREPPPQLVILDEPTNNLDISSVGQLVEALAAYRGALLVVSHDYRFLRDIGIDTVLALDENGAVTSTPGTSALELPGDPTL
ncbi:ABC-F family ATP-binding cassette domain-containing protein [Jongsikchunia kroppenstedtii]|uniref:ABC-F family ATP-binding cassette domain-containing protein n=1 Tax=Jongsikchunia kroppenstedtii TaxID=1121721 RepID=UPI000689198C|nr:ABC-F family ATP-binding cassette domain-containing protein [Jongsikchunia kroppenstedtii]